MSFNAIPINANTKLKDGFWYISFYYFSILIMYVFYRVYKVAGTYAARWKSRDRGHMREVT